MKYPWMPLFWGDFLANTMHLSAQEAGAYLFLIAHAWEKNGRIPIEPVRLARIAHVREDRWKTVWKAISVFFEPEADGPLMTGYRHERVCTELARLGKIANKRKDAAVQMHSKRIAKADASTSTSNRDYSNGKEAKGSSVQMHSKPYKSDNVLVPIPEKPQRGRQ